MWGWTIEVNSNYKNSADRHGLKAFNIQYEVPEEACIELITQDWSSANVGAINISASEELVIIPPAKIDDAVKACNAGGYNAVSLYILFDIDTSDSMWKDGIDYTKTWLAGS